MPLFDHLGELRRRVTLIIATVLFASVVLYFVAPVLILVLLQPVTEYLTASGIPVTNLEELRQELVVLGALEGFTIKFKVALVFSIVVCCPIWIWQLLGFFLPALKPNERKWVIPTFFAAISLFVAGTLFCYFVILGAAFGWLLGQAEDFSTVVPYATYYIDTILLFEVGFGIAFELPLVVFYLTVFNIVPYRKLRESWRVVYIVLMVVCAIVTPDANPVTMILMFAAMAVLYEGSLFLSRIVLARRLARQKREERGESNSGGDGKSKSKGKSGGDDEDDKSDESDDESTGAGKGKSDKDDE
jgi:sec-independent protein translocase protein TatC